MGLPLTDGDRKLSPYFVSTAKIIGAVNLSGKTLPFQDKPIEIGLTLVLDVGKSFTPELNVFGAFKRNANNEIVQWGSAFKIKNLYEALCPEMLGELADQYVISDEALERMKGKEILRLSYVYKRSNDGKVKYIDWNDIGTPEKGEQELTDRFLRSVRAGFPKNYSPEILTGELEGATSPLEALTGGK